MTYFDYITENSKSKSIIYKAQQIYYGHQKNTPQLFNSTVIIVNIFQ